MEEIEKAYSIIPEKMDKTEFKILCSKDIYETIDIKEYKGLEIRINSLMPNNYVCIGKLIM